MTRDKRRHNLEIAKARVARVIKTVWRNPKLAEDETFVGRHAVTPHPCSCLMCGNRRRWAGPTRQELKHAGTETSRTTREN